MLREDIFFGHIIRRERSEDLLSTGKIKGRRICGRQRETLTDSLRHFMSTTPPAACEIPYRKQNHGRKCPLAWHLERDQSQQENRDTLERRLIGILITVFT